MLITSSTVAGALLGCAVGDAMGAPFEGLWAESIPPAEALLASFHEYHGYPRGQYTDDTQLTVATLESIVAEEAIVPADVAKRIAELWRHHDVVGPGGACTHAAEHFLATNDWTNMGAPRGQAGNGTAMRTAVIGLWFVDCPWELPSAVAELAKLTHTDERSVAGGIAVAEAARYLAVVDSPLDPSEFCESVARACASVHSELASWIRELPERRDDPKLREFIAWAGQTFPEFDKPIITPFVVPTVLASLASVICHPQSWSDAITFAIGLGGDVDTLGAIVGALAGARHGIDAIPRALVDNVHRSEYLQALASQFHEAIRRRRPREQPDS